MEQIKTLQVECYECTDGNVFIKLDDAEAHQMELDAKHELVYLVQDNTDTEDHEEYVFEFIWEHRHDLARILKFK